MFIESVVPSSCIKWSVKALLTQSLQLTRDRFATKIAEVSVRLQRSRQAFFKSPTGRRLKSVAGSLLNLLKRLTATNFSRKEVSKVANWSATSRRQVTDQSPTSRRPIGDYNGVFLFGDRSPINRRLVT